MSEAGLTLLQLPFCGAIITKGLHHNMTFCGVVPDICALSHTPQECIPVGCVLPAAVAIRGVCLSACWDTPWVWAWRPPRCVTGDPLGCGPGDTPRCGPGDPLGVGLETVPLVRPLNFPLGVDLETCKACWDTTPKETCCKACWDNTPPVNRITDTCKNITLLLLPCER